MIWTKGQFGVAAVLTGEAAHSVKLRVCLLVCPRPCGGYKHDISDSRLVKVRSFLENSIGRYNWVNLQGPGFDDAYRYRWNPKKREYSPKIEKLARAWWQKNYPEKTEFEI